MFEEDILSEFRFHPSRFGPFGCGAVGRHGRNARGGAEGREGKAESRRAQPRTVHLRQARRVGERCREENWGGCRPSVPSRRADGKVVTLTYHSSVENEAIQDEVRKSVIGGKALILLA